MMMKCRGRVGLQGERERESTNWNAQKKNLLAFSSNQSLHQPEGIVVISHSSEKYPTPTFFHSAPPHTQLPTTSWNSLVTARYQNKKRGIQEAANIWRLVHRFQICTLCRFRSAVFPEVLVGLALVGCGSCTLLHFRFFFFFPQQSVSHRLFCCVQEIPASQAAFNRTRTHIYSRLHFCIPHKKDLVEVRQM